jgi:hypothetical protein
VVQAVVVMERSLMMCKQQTVLPTLAVAVVEHLKVQDLNLRAADQEL